MILFAGLLVTKLLQTVSACARVCLRVLGQGACVLS